MKSDTKLARISGMFKLIGVIVLLQSYLSAQQSGKWVAPESARQKKNPVSLDQASIEAGKKLYVKECLSCHGKKGEGDGPKAAELEKEPGDFTTDEFQKQSDGAIFWKITQGRKPMASFKKEFTDEQRWQLVNYIRTFGREASKKE